MKVTALWSRSAFRGRCIGAVLGAALLGVGVGPALAVESVVPMTIVINQSPWFSGFQSLIEYYEDQTGNKVSLDVNPFAGSIEKQRSSARAPTGTLDLFIVNALIMPEMYSSGLIHSLNDIDPAFKLDPELFSFDDTTCWNEAKRVFDCTTGKLMGVPINPNIHLLYYRSDLYEEAGLTVPETFDELLANAKALNDPPRRFGMVQRNGRSFTAISFNFRPYLLSFGGSIFADRKAADYTVTVNSKEAKAALDFYIALGEQTGPPNAGSISQAQQVQLFATGKAAHMFAVIASFDQLDDPNKSIVADKFKVATIPHSATHPLGLPLGHFVGVIPRNIPEDRKQAVMEFLKWFQTFEAQKKYAEFGSPPVRRDVLRTDLADQPKFRWMRALSGGLEFGRVFTDLPQGAEITGITDLRFNQAVTGELSVAEALNLAAEEIHAVVTAAGLKTGRLPDLQ